VPEKAQGELRADSVALRDAFYAYAEEALEQFIDYRDRFDAESIFDSDSVQRHVEEFSDQQAFVYVWEDYRVRRSGVASVFFDIVGKSDFDEIEESEFEMLRSVFTEGFKLGRQTTDMWIDSLFANTESGPETENRP